jgi:hypothetical protein
MEHNLLHQQTVTLESLHGIVGLLRARISYVMKAVTDTRQELNRTFQSQPEELSVIMINSQDHLSKLFQLSDLCWLAREGAAEPDTVFKSATDTFKDVKVYFEWLSEFSIQGFVLDTQVFTSAISLVEEYFENEKNRIKNLSL